MTKVEIEAGLNPIRGQVMNISHLLPVGAKYFTVEPKDVDLKFVERKNEIAQNPKLPILSPTVVLVPFSYRIIAYSARSLPLT